VIIYIYDGIQIGATQSFCFVLKKSNIPPVVFEKQLSFLCASQGINGSPTGEIVGEHCGHAATIAAPIYSHCSYPHGIRPSNQA
jgi:hypothetical protein